MDILLSSYLIFQETKVLLQTYLKIKTILFKSCFYKKKYYIYRISDLVKVTWTRLETEVNEKGHEQMLTWWKVLIEHLNGRQRAKANVRLGQKAILDLLTDKFFSLKFL